jgi:hypothetical protein
MTTPAWTARNALFYTRPVVKFQQENRMKTISMKHIGTLALMLNIGAAGLYAQQQSVKMTFSGTAVPSAIILQAGVGTGEDSFAGKGTLGSFTYRDLETEAPAPQPATCSGPKKLYSLRVVTTGVFGFKDGSLLMVNLMQGSDCVDLAAQQAHCTIIFKITGGTGRFQKASGILTFDETVRPVLADISGAPVFFASTGTFTGTVSGVTGDGEGQGGRH